GRRRGGETGRKATGGRKGTLPSRPARRILAGKEGLPLRIEGQLGFAEIGVLHTPPHRTIPNESKESNESKVSLPVGSWLELSVPPNKGPAWPSPCSWSNEFLRGTGGQRGTAHLLRGHGTGESPAQVVAGNPAAPVASKSAGKRKWQWSAQSSWAA